MNAPLFVHSFFEVRANSTEWEEAHHDSANLEHEVGGQPSTMRVKLNAMPMHDTAVAITSFHSVLSLHPRQAQQWQPQVLLLSELDAVFTSLGGAKEAPAALSSLSVIGIECSLHGERLLTVLKTRSGPLFIFESAIEGQLTDAMTAAQSFRPLKKLLLGNCHCPRPTMRVKS